MKAFNVLLFTTLATLFLGATVTPAGSFDLKIEGGGAMTAEADLSKSAGTFGMQEIDISATAVTALDDKNTLDAMASLAILTFDFGDALLVTDQTDPFENIVVVDLGVNHAYQTDSKWQLLSGLGVRIAAESGADTDAVTVGLLAGGSYKVSGSLNAGLALVGRTRIEDGVAVVPVPVIEWDITDALVLQTQYGYTRQGAELAYMLNGANTLSVGAHYETVRFRTKGTTADTDNRVGQYDRIPVSLGWHHMFNQHAFVALNLDLVAWHELKLDAENGDNLGKDEPDSTLGFGVRGGLMF